uniref:Uncharacterized protein n=1 Tax=Arundo donax TaxID=35708 RepID=A0A0A9TEF4_ARUDO
MPAAAPLTKGSNCYMQVSCAKILAATH